MLPAATIGGDLYDFVEAPGDRLVILVGDVSGKGVPAALVMAKVISDFRAAAMRSPSPSAILEELNAGLVSRTRRGMFVTAACLALDADSGRVSYADAGHLPGLWYRQATAVAQPVEAAGGPPLGILAGMQYPDREFLLGGGDTLLLYTDGVLEARSPAAALFGIDRIAEVMCRRLPATADLIGDILGAVRAHVHGAPLHDDATLVAVHWRPSS